MRIQATFRARPSVAPPAFSLVELMVVIGVMAILAGVLIAALPGIQSKVNRNKVETFLAELQGGLSAYQLDHGIYPQNPPAGGRDSSGIDGANILYKHLSGDWTETGTVDFEQEEKVYVPRLDFESNRNASEKRSDAIGGRYMVIDAFGNPVRYLAQPPNIPPSERETINPDYDLWSIVDADPTDPREQARHITNWQAN